MEIKKEVFGKAKNGEEVYLFTLKNKRGMVAKITNYGAAIVSLLVPNKDGHLTDVVLGFDRAEGYQENKFFFGVTVGRNANRIKGAKVIIDGKEYELAKNEEGHNLHTHYEEGMHKRVWEPKVDEEGNKVCFSYVSPDGECGFPGTLKMDVTYILTEDDAIEIHYYGVSDKDTVINVTNHSYVNLAGHDGGTIENEKILIHGSKYTPVTHGSIPTGELADVQGTPMDFRSLKRIGDSIDEDWEQLNIAGGYDHNWVLDKEKGALEKIAMVVDEESGKVMEVYSDMPCVQFYAGNGMGQIEGKGGSFYDRRGGLCLETQFFPNSPNEPAFPSAIFKAGEKFISTTIYKFL
ncbi:MAG: galactose mutarotase [Lachnospiraceae bacterium]|nr:galactose mutarotase [Lachnospiraceae bacterium]